ncbi:hypothetical protein [Roseibium sp. MMSF_3544]|uniref:hypothetical protein n=1 Tax=unclassified Roseibium TaxID=2629323 RepID=UPI00273E2719|nr:hypothetical protein [Roseibium sp. MMSF_3544]
MTIIPAFPGHWEQDHGNKLMVVAWKISSNGTASPIAVEPGSQVEYVSPYEASAPTVGPVPHTPPKTAAPAPVKPAPVPIPPAPVAKPPAAPASDAGYVKQPRVASTFEIKSSSVHGPNASSKQRYLAFSLKNDITQSLLLKFMRNSPNEQERWDRLLREFYLKTGIDAFEDTSELNGYTVNLNVWGIPPHSDTLAGLDSIANALGVRQP